MTTNEDMARAVAAAIRLDGTLREDRAADNRRHVRDQVRQRDPALARTIDALLREPAAGTTRPARATRGTR